jgi:hypothetical protein
MSEIIKNYVRYVPMKDNDTTKHPEYFIYSLKNEYLGHITYSSKQIIIFTEYKSGLNWFNVYPWPIEDKSNLQLSKPYIFQNTFEKQMYRKNNKENKFECHRNFQKQYARQNQKHCQKIHPHMRFKLQQR